MNAKMEKILKEYETIYDLCEDRDCLLKTPEERFDKIKEIVEYRIQHVLMTGAF